MEVCKKDLKKNLETIGVEFMMMRKHLSHSKVNVQGQTKYRSLKVIIVLARRAFDISPKFLHPRKLGFRHMGANVKRPTG